jgi:hypothetical protein
MINDDPMFFMTLMQYLAMIPEDSFLKISTTLPVVNEPPDTG